MILLMTQYKLHKFKYDFCPFSRVNLLDLALNFNKKIKFYEELLNMSYTYHIKKEESSVLFSANTLEKINTGSSSLVFVCII